MKNFDCKHQEDASKRTIHTNLTYLWPYCGWLWFCLNQISKIEALTALTKSMVAEASSSIHQDLDQSLHPVRNSTEEIIKKKNDWDTTGVWVNISPKESTHNKSTSAVEMVVKTRNIQGNQDWEKVAKKKSKRTNLSRNLKFLKDGCPTKL